MIANVIVGMLCLHLVCYAGLFLLISRRLQGPDLGMSVFALSSLLLGTVYILQLWEGGMDWGWMSVVNHSLTVCSMLGYWIGGRRFFGHRARLWKPLLLMAAGYTALQLLVYHTMGLVMRYALLSAVSALIFLSMMAVLLGGIRNFARTVRTEALVFACIIGGLGVLNAIKCAKILEEGLLALEMDTHFQIAFYGYMSFLATILAPSIVWLVLRRLTDALRETAARDPLTQLLNRRGLMEQLQTYFRLRTARPAYLMIVDIDHFKRVNDTYGHQVGDEVLCRVARLLQETARQGDLVSRTGGEEFIVVCLETDGQGILRVAERMRAVVERQKIGLLGESDALRCTVTIGVSGPFRDAAALDQAIREADEALYRGKSGGRNRVEVRAPEPQAPIITTCSPETEATTL